MLRSGDAMKRVIFFVCMLTAFALTASAELPSTLERGDQYQAKIKTKVIKKLKLPKGYHEGLFWDNGKLLLANGEGGKIWVIDPADGKVTSEITPLGKFAEGITSAGDGTYWYTDWDSRKIYRVKIANGGMDSVYDISLDDARPAGVAWTGKKLFMITWTRSVTGTKYHLLEMNGNEKLFRKMEIKRIHEPAHMTWDGKNLWLTSWFSQLVYKIDIDTYKVVGSFKSPAAESTGIAWDGKSFWITGTSADLYQVDIQQGDEGRS